MKARKTTFGMGKPCPKCGETDPEKFYATSSNCRDCHRKWTRDHRLRKLGIDTHTQAQAFDAQGGKCAICGNAEQVFERNGRQMGGLHQDHCHTTGKARALLCSRCNQLLGRAKEDTSVLRAAADYLDRWR